MRCLWLDYSAVVIVSGQFRTHVVAISCWLASPCSVWLDSFTMDRGVFSLCFGHALVPWSITKYDEINLCFMKNIWDILKWGQKLAVNHFLDDVSWKNSLYRYLYHFNKGSIYYFIFFLSKYQYEVIIKMVFPPYRSVLVVMYAESQVMQLYGPLRGCRL